MLTCLDKITEQANATGKLDEASVSRAIDVIRTFADKGHHGKEENHLFATLVNKGMPRQGGPVGQMLLEHEQGREYVEGMTRSVSGAAAGGPSAVLAKCQRLYSTLASP